MCGLIKTTVWQFIHFIPDIEFWWLKLLQKGRGFY